MTGSDRRSMWQAVDALVDAAPSFEHLRWHGLHLLAARRRREQGAAVPQNIRVEQRLAAVRALGAPELLRRLRDAVDGPVILVKGPEVAVRYPDPLTRPYRDLDVLVSDSVAAQKALRAAGFREVGEPSMYRGIHHLRPLQWDGHPLWIEVHHQPKWPDGLSAPTAAELTDRAVCHAAVDVGGVAALDPAAHAVLLAAHAWAHTPLARLSHLVDIAAVVQEADAAEVRGLAERWGCARLWRTTERAVDALFNGSAPSLAMRTWARHLAAARERTVFERHVQESAAPLWGLPPVPGANAAAATLLGTARRNRGESWKSKLHRSQAALRNAARAKSLHDAELAEPGRDPR
ncbi:MAG TPA: nucleotidyltransferase family protein [Baekduia sp.]|uniref:nucleotidyltransferase family protein n=1 Tax=Baekduia sp. TaxID=2600305 RepID=UPI002BFFA836|nr:nucleotidyltransferase family protein [Baekduia sp.]HMJ34006.1 nucleotidyltransferase family protein [Baekduia sp.]